MLSNFVIGVDPPDELPLAGMAYRDYKGDWYVVTHKDGIEIITKNGQPVKSEDTPFNIS